MAAADVSGLIEIASSPDSPVPLTPDPPETDIETTPEGVTPDETTDDGTSTPEAAPKDEDAKPDARKIIGDARKALKAFRDSSPENAPLARQLNDIVGRYDGYKSIFPKVADAQAAKSILDAVGGNEGIASLQSTIRSVNETDTLLYNGDPKVLDNLLEDMRKEGKTDAFGKLAGPFLEKLRGLDEKAYRTAFDPHFHRALVDSSFPDVVEALNEFLSAATPDVEGAKKTIASMRAWFAKLSSSVETGAKASLDPDRQAFERERTEFQTQKTKEFQNSVKADWNRENNRALGTALKDYMKLPFAKNWTDATKQSIERELTSNLLDDLTKDKGYQSQMDAFWASKSPDKTKIINFHKSQLDLRAKRIVKDVLEARYPGFSRAKLPMAAKPAAGGQPAPATAIPTKPMFVSTKPSPEEMDMTKDPNRYLLASGRAYLKNGRFVAWSPRYK